MSGKKRAGASDGEPESAQAHATQKERVSEREKERDAHIQMDKHLCT